MPHRNVIFDDDNPEWTEEDFARARPASEVLPAAVAESLVRKRGRPAGSNKERVTMRLDRDVVEKFRAGGPGWQSRINEVLKQADIKARNGRDENGSIGSAKSAGSSTRDLSRSRSGE